MTTTLNAAQKELSRQLGDFFNSTTDGAGTSTTLVDSVLKAYENDWIQDWPWVMLTEEPGGAAAIYDIRKVASLDNSTGTLTTLAFDAAPGTGIDYELHRLFHPDDKNRALVYAARAAFPSVHEVIRNEEIVAGNWLSDGSLERWTSSTDPTLWTADTLTVTETTTGSLVKHGATSAKLDTAAGFLYQDIGLWDDLERLAGRNVIFTVQGHCDTASCLRIAIFDGTTTTFSEYHPGNSAWTEDREPLRVEATIATTPTDVEFRIYSDVAAGTSYVDDARVMGPEGARQYIGHLGLAQNLPQRVSVEQFDYSNRAPFLALDDVRFDHESGYLRTPWVRDRRLRIEGMGYLDFLVSGVSSTAWTATINIDSPQTDILVAQAALYLYTW
ncbi:hypothetical protein LCGC14_1976500, partial [marine sediment metagenome]